MSKWKCEICGNEFENFHAQGFDNKIYCPLCFYKEENKRLNQKYLNAVADYEKEKFNVEELKKQLKEYKLITIDYQELEARNKELKKQIQERPKEYVFIGNAQNKTRDFINQITKDNKEYKNQQKEFIEYMNKTIEECNNYSKYIDKKTKELHGRSYGKTYIANEIMKNEVAKKILKEILSKYKEIIGDKCE